MSLELLSVFEIKPVWQSQRDAQEVGNMISLL